MRKIWFFGLLLFGPFTWAQTATGFEGKWMALDEQTSRPLAIIELRPQNGEWVAKIISIVDPAKQQLLCQNCPSPFTDQKVIGMEIIHGLKKEGDKLQGGFLIDPRHGKMYDCYVSLEGPDRLKVRGYWLWTLLGKTQYWRRVKS